MIIHIIILAELTLSSDHYHLTPTHFGGLFKSKSSAQPPVKSTIASNEVPPFDCHDHVDHVDEKEEDDDGDQP